MEKDADEVKRTKQSSKLKKLTIKLEISSGRDKSSERVNMYF